MEQFGRMQAGTTITVSGSVELVWDSGAEDGLLLTIEPDVAGMPHTFELKGELHERVAAEITEGRRVEVEIALTEYEVVDPDSGPSDATRAEVRDIRLLN